MAATSARPRPLPLATALEKAVKLHRPLPSEGGARIDWPPETEELVDLVDWVILLFLYVFGAVHLEVDVEVVALPGLLRVLVSGVQIGLVVKVTARRR